MEKRSSNFRSSFVDDDFEIEEPIPEVVKEERVKLEPPASVRLRSQYPGILNARGSVTGTMYHFPGAGSVSEVDAQDVPSLLAKVFGGNSCCGSGTKPTPKFVLVE